MVTKEPLPPRHAYFKTFLPKGKSTKRRGYNPSAITVRNPVLLQGFLEQAVSNVEIAFPARNEKYNLSCFFLSFLFLFLFLFLFSFSFAFPKGAVFIHKGMKRRQQRTITGVTVVVASDGEHRQRVPFFNRLSGQIDIN